MLTSKKPARGKGWTRALLFLVIFFGINVFGFVLYNQTSISKGEYQLYGGAAVFALTALILLPVFTILIDRRSLSSLGFNWRVENKDPVAMQTTKNRVSTTRSNNAVFGSIMAMVILGGGSLALYATGNLRFSDGSATLVDFTTALILMAVIAVAEEGVFRGYVLNNLLDSFNPWLALIISALLFAFFHSGNPGAGWLAITNVFLAGILLGIGFIYNRNLWFAVFFHFTWNFVQGPVLGFPVSGLTLKSVLQTKITGNALLTGGNFGFEGSLIQTILFIPAILVLYRFYKARTPKQERLVSQ